jgi:TubC N-terminal docking domain
MSAPVALGTSAADREIAELRVVAAQQIDSLQRGEQKLQCLYGPRAGDNMSNASTSLPELLMDCDAHGIRLRPGKDGSLTIDAPCGTLTPELLGQLKTHKTQVLALLLRADELDADSAPDAEPAPIIEPGTNSNAVCRCGSTKWRDVPIHDGQSIRRDCGRCGRFIDFAVWYGKNTGHKVQQSIGWFTWSRNALRN